MPPNGQHRVVESVITTATLPIPLPSRSSVTLPLIRTAGMSATSLPKVSAFTVSVSASLKFRRPFHHRSM